MSASALNSIGVVPATSTRYPAALMFTSAYQESFLRGAMEQTVRYTAICSMVIRNERRGKC